MDDVAFIWDLDDDPDGNVQHIAEHGLTKDEVASVFAAADAITEESRSSGSPLTRGTTYTGRYVIVVWEHIDENPLTVYPVTAYEPEPEG